MQTITVPNFKDANIKEHSKLDADTIVGATTLALAHSNDMATNDYLYVGRLGSEGAELTTIATVPSISSATTAALVKPHSRFDDVTVLFGNKIKVYRASNVDGTVPADASFSVVGTSNNIDVDQVSTSIIDADGGSDYWYKATYYNSTTSGETPLADAIASRGGGYGDYASIESIRNDAGLQNNHFITDAQINEKRQAAQSLINGQLTGIYTIPFIAPINPHIAEITRKLAAGYLLTNDYGMVSSFSTNNGKAKVEWAIDQLNKLKARETTLTDNAGTDTSISTTSGLQMWPNTTTADADTSAGGSARMFRTGDRY